MFSGLCDSCYSSVTNSERIDTEVLPENLFIWQQFHTQPMAVWIISIKFASYLTGNRPLTCKRISKRQRPSKGVNAGFAKGEALHLLTPNSSRSTSIKKRTEFQICLKNKKIPRIWFWQTYLWNYFLGERLILKKKKIARTHENITFCNTISPGVPTDLNPPVQIR